MRNNVTVERIPIEMRERIKEDRNRDELVIYREQKLEAVALH